MSQRITSILVPTDGSDRAELGARRGIDLAATLDANLHILSAVNVHETDPTLGDPTEGMTAEQKRLSQLRAEAAISSVARSAKPHISQQIIESVEWGVPFRVIADYVDTHDIDLVVMGTHGRSGFERYILGSVTEKVLRTVATPVFAVPPNTDEIELGSGEYRELLLPTDDSEGAAYAVDWGVSLAAVYNSRVHPLYSVDTSGLVSAITTKDLHTELERTGEDVLAEVHRRASPVGVPVDEQLRTGPAAEAILGYCAETDIDLIVMGTHGRSGINRYLIGSVTETVLRNADVPVCCIPMASKTAHSQRASIAPDQPPIE